MSADVPIQIMSKIAKATRKIGSVSRGLPGIPVGALYYWGYQKASGRNKHSTPCGRRHTRFYQGIFKTGAKIIKK